MHMAASQGREFAMRVQEAAYGLRGVGADAIDGRHMNQANRSAPMPRSRNPDIKFMIKNMLLLDYFFVH